MATSDDVREAWLHLRGIVHQTPVIQSRTLDEMAGGRVYLKMESFQRSGAFKFRGAFHALTRTLAQARARGVVTGSSGNHGGALALAARILGVSATVVVPEDIEGVKLEALEGYGARVVVAGRSSAERLDAAQQIADRDGMLMVHPYDNPLVIAGQGTVAMECLEQVPDVDVFIAPVGGGGLLAGCASYINDEMPSVEVWGAEPALADDTFRSMKEGRRVSIPLPDTIADGARNLTPGELTFPIIRRTCRGILRVGEDQIRDAMKLLLLRAKVVVEPTGALATAAVLFEGGLAGRTAVVVVSGGNAGLDLIKQCV